MAAAAAAAEKARAGQQAEKEKKRRRRDTSTDSNEERAEEGEEEEEEEEEPVSLGWSLCPSARPAGAGKSEAVRTFWSALAAQGVALRVVKAAPISRRTRSRVPGATQHTPMARRTEGPDGVTEAVKAGENHKKKQRKSQVRSVWARGCKEHAWQWGNGCNSSSHARLCRMVGALQGHMHACIAPSMTLWPSCGQCSAFASIFTHLQEKTSFSLPRLYW